jgi:hypothetical protein
VDSAGDAGVDVAQALLGERERTPFRVAVVAVAAVDDGVAGGAERQQVANGVLNRLARRQRQHDDALSDQARAQGGEVLDALDVLFPGQGLLRGLGMVVADDARAAARQAPRHAGAHAPETDDSDFHERCLRLWGLALIWIISICCNGPPWWSR